mgnify:CR=1 FL=1
MLKLAEINTLENGNSPLLTDSIINGFNKQPFIQSVAVAQAVSFVTAGNSLYRIVMTVICFLRLSIKKQENI